MTFTLTNDQVEDAYIDLGLSLNTVFSSSELNRFFNRASGDYDKMLVYAVRSLRADSSKLHDYSAAQSGESLSQVFKNLGELLKEFEARAGFGGVKMTTGTIMLNIDATLDNESEWDGTSE